MARAMIHNPHLEGDPFFWPGGPDGVLLVHGYTATTAEVRPLAKSLYEHGYTVAGPLLPGHNTYPEDANRYKWQDWMRTVETAHREIASRCERVVVGGESTGALLVLKLASEHPEIVAVLAYAPALRLNLGIVERIGLRVLSPFIPYFPKKRMSAESLWRGYPVNPLKGTIQIVRLQRVVRACLPRVRQPLLVMQGRLDETVHPSAPQTIFDGVGSVVKELHWMEHSAHAVIIDQERGQAAGLTIQFLERVLGN